MSSKSDAGLEYKDQGLTNAISARRLHNESACIFRILPTEVLRLLVSALAHDAEDVWQDGVFDVTPGLSLSHSCARWREIATTTPEIWTIIPLTFAKWTRECLRRSQPLPIVVSSEAGEASERSKAAALKHLGRVRMLVLEHEDAEDEGSPALTAPAPMLECIRAIFAFQSERQPAIFCDFFGGQQPPRLKEVSISNAMLHGVPIPFMRTRTIKSLNFSCCTLWSNLEEMMDTLACVPELEELIIEYSNIVLEFPPSWDPPPTDDASASIIPLQLPRLKNLWMKVNFFEAALVLRHVSLPTDIHTIGLHIMECPDDSGPHYKALFLPTLAPIYREIYEKPIKSRTLTFSMSSKGFHIMASKPLQPGVALSPYAGRSHVISNDRAGDGSFLSLKFGFDPLTESGCSILAAVTETASPLFSVGSLTLNGALDESVALSEWAWPTALRHLRVTDHLELSQAGGVGLILQHDTTWYSKNSPSTLCLRDVVLDTTNGFPAEPENFEESQESTFFDALIARIRPWWKSKSLKRIVIRECPLQPWMLDELEERLGKEAVDWDRVFPGFDGEINGNRVPYYADTS
ncbi:hypothetical protein PENSPDRAFT_659100 [Peniophora sp. CONT]|nr:hypothetical protein PENSPDRAFT_659100 [Peniophora sp. CONT]